jgi:hypothetical protein
MIEEYEWASDVERPCPGIDDRKEIPYEVALARDSQVGIRHSDELKTRCHTQVRRLLAAFRRSLAFKFQVVEMGIEIGRHDVMILSG